jgi:hypothetical protein
MITKITRVDYDDDSVNINITIDGQTYPLCGKYSNFEITFDDDKGADE